MPQGLPFGYALGLGCVWPAWARQRQNGLESGGLGRLQGRSQGGRPCFVLPAFL